MGLGTRLEPHTQARPTPPTFLPATRHAVDLSMYRLHCSHITDLLCVSRRGYWLQFAHVPGRQSDACPKRHGDPPAPAAAAAATRSAACTLPSTTSPCIRRPAIYLSPARRLFLRCFTKTNPNRIPVPAQDTLAPFSGIIGHVLSAEVRPPPGNTPDPQMTWHLPPHRPLSCRYHANCATRFWAISLSHRTSTRLVPKRKHSIYTNRAEPPGTHTSTHALACLHAPLQTSSRPVASSDKSVWNTTLAFSTLPCLCHRQIPRKSP